MLLIEEPDEWNGMEIKTENYLIYKTISFYIFAFYVNGNGFRLGFERID